MTALTGTGLLVRQALRRDRILASVWIVLLVVVVYASAAATVDLYPTEADRVRAADAINASPAIVALYGPILVPTSIGELSMTKMTVLYAVFVALLVVVLVRRHTRVEEESGRAELVAGTAMGRPAPLAAAVVEAVIVTLVLGVLTALASGGGGLPWAGSVGFAATWVGIAWVSIGLTALACQVSASARTCAGLAAAGLGAWFALRVVGDLGPEWVSWLSPFGWNTRLRAWSDPRWWVLGLYLLLGAGLLAAAVALRSRRDLGSGLVAARPGPAEGSPRLADAVVLAWRVHRTTLWTWTLATAVLGLLMGAVAPTVSDFLDSEAGRAMIESIGGVGPLQDAMVAAIFSVAAVVITCFAVAVVGHGAGDEQDGRTEQVLATATSRTRAFVATAVIALGGSAWLLAVTGMATVLGMGRDAAGASGPLGIVAAALVQVPAVWVLAAAALLLYAVGPGWVRLGWGLVVAALVVGEFGDLLHLPDALVELSPYRHVPSMPAEPFDGVQVVALTVVAAALALVAWWRFRERDIG